MTPDEYHMDVLQNLITYDGEEIARTQVSLQSSGGGLGDEVSGLIARLIGVHALSDDVCATFEKPETIALSARAPSKTLPFLQHLADLTDQGSLKQQIADTMAYVQNVQSSIH